MTASTVQQPSTATPAPMKHRLDIEGLRAVAVSLVVLDHLLGWPAGGFVGVDVFFVISGFLITGLLLKEHAATGRISLLGFYRRRARRILPASMLVLGVTVLATAAIAVGERVQQTATDALWSAGFLANWHFAAMGTDYFGAGRVVSPVQHFWSLAVEEQFYVVWPTVLLLVLGVSARRGGRRARLQVAGGLVTLAVAASFAWSVSQTQTEPTVAYFSTLTRTWELGVGALMAVAAAGLSRLPSLVRPVLAWAGLAGIIASAFLIDGSTAFPGHAAALPVLSTASVIAAGTGARHHRYIPVLTNPVSAYLGRISYSLYLWHWPVIVLVGTISVSGTATALAGAAGFACAVASFHLLEDPIRRGTWLSRRSARVPSTVSRAGAARTGRSRHRSAAAGASPLLAAMTALTVVLGGYAFHVPGFDLLDDRSPRREAVAAVAATVPSSTPSSPATPQEQLTAKISASIAPQEWGDLDPSLDQLDEARAPEWTQDGCAYVTEESDDRCVYGPSNATMSAVVLGDSVALSWVPGIRAALEPKGWSVHVLTRIGCPAPMVRTYNDPASSKELNTDCLRHKARVQRLIRELKPELVIMSSAKRFFDRQYDDPQGAQAVASWELGTRDAITAVKPFSTRVVVLGSPPTTGNLASCVTRFSDPVACTRDLDDGWKTVSAAEESAARAVGAVYVDTSPWVCTQGRCPAVVSTTPVMVDGTHLTAAYSRSLAPFLQETLTTQ